MTDFSKENKILDENNLTITTERIVYWSTQIKLDNISPNNIFIFFSFLWKVRICIWFVWFAFTVRTILTFTDKTSWSIGEHLIILIISVARIILSTFLFSLSKFDLCLGTSQTDGIFLYNLPDYFFVRKVKKILIETISERNYLFDKLSADNLKKEMNSIEWNIN